MGSTPKGSEAMSLHTIKIIIGLIMWGGPAFWLIVFVPRGLDELHLVLLEGVLYWCYSMFVVFPLWHRDFYLDRILEIRKGDE